MSKAVPPLHHTKLKMCVLYRLLSTKASWSDSLVLESDSISSLEWWLDYVEDWNGAPIKVKLVECQVFSDASDIDWGAVLNGKEALGVWSTELAFSYQ